MSKIQKPFDESLKAITPSGYQYEKVYTQAYDKAGRPVLEEIGTKNIVEMINSNKDNANYEKLIKKFKVTGDISFLNGKQGFYADMTGVPDNLIDAYNSIEKAKFIFETLDAETRAEYKNSVTEFIADFGSEKFMKAFGVGSDSVIKESEVKVDAAE